MDILSTQGISLIQSKYGAGHTHKNFELVLSSNYGGLQHWYRDNNDNYTWKPVGGATPHPGNYFGHGYVTGCSVVEKNRSYSNDMNYQYDVVAIEGSNLWHYKYRENIEKHEFDAEKNHWKYSKIISTEVRGSPSIIKASSNHLEVVAPSKEKGIVHLWQNSSSEWQIPPVLFATELGKVDAVALLENQVPDHTNNLELIARVGGSLYHLYRISDSNNPEYLNWYNVNQLPVSNASGIPAFIQTSDGNFQVITPVENGEGLCYMYRDLSSENYKWHTVFSKNTVYGATTIKGVGLIQSSYGNLELQLQTDNGIASLYGNIQSSHWNLINVKEKTIFCKEYEEQKNFSNKGQWVVPYTSGVIGINSAMLRDNKVLFYDYGTNFTEEAKFPNNNTGPGTGQGEYAILDVNTGYIVKEGVTGNNLFCSGLTFLKDGTVVVVGGHGHDDSADYSIKAVFTINKRDEDWRWASQGKIEYGRWYPTCTTLPDGESIFVISGTKADSEGAKGHQGNSFNFSDCKNKPGEVNDTYQIILKQNNNPLDSNYLKIENGDITKKGTQGKQGKKIKVKENGTTKDINTTDTDYFGYYPEGKKISTNICVYGIYPYVYVLPDGRLFLFGNNVALVLRKEGDVWFVDDGPKKTHSLYPRIYPVGGTSVLLPLEAKNNFEAKIMVMGGAGGDVCPTIPLTKDTKATNTCEIYNVSTKKWTQTEDMGSDRMMPNAVLLPDKTVLVSSGGGGGYSDHLVDPVFKTEIYNPETDEWTQMNEMRVPRLYHSSAILLPDGRVITAGKGGNFNHTPYKYHERRVEVFYPPYLFKSKESNDSLRSDNGSLRSDEERPIIVTTLSNAMDYNTSSFEVTITVPTDLNTNTVPTDLDVNSLSFVLIAPGASTHGLDMHQRLIELEKAQKSTTQGYITFTLTSPPNSNVAPKGYYMLFAVHEGIPSKAKWIQLA